MTRDRGRETTFALTEVRTVLSRAETAVVSIRRFNHGRDPEAEEMIAELRAVVERLERWRRTGRSRP